MDIVINIGDSVLVDSVVSKFGNSGHVFVGKEFIGEGVKIVFGKSEIIRKMLKVDFLKGEIIGRKVKKFGTGAHVIVPREYVGKKIKLVIGR